jgi:SMI1 / KNR4 family (SUKH-1)
MGRIANRIHANQQCTYLTGVRQAWGKYFLSGWLREKLGIDEKELNEYAYSVHGTIKTRLDDGRLNPIQLFKDKGIEEMLEELDRNTMRFKSLYEEYWYISENEEEDDENNDDQRPNKKQNYTAPNTILRAPATAEQIAAAESKLGRPLPLHLKEFYSITNGTRPVVWGHGGQYIKGRLPAVQSLEWVEDDWKNGCLFELFPAVDLPVKIKWPGVEGGRIAMYEHDGQGTEFLWYLNEDLVARGKKAFDEAYQKASEEDKKILGRLVEEYHGSWETLREMKACWVQHAWEIGGIGLFHDFKAFLSVVVFDSRFEDNRSPVKAPEDQ